MKVLHIDGPAALSGLGEVGVFLSFASPDFARLGKVIGENTHLERLQFNDTDVEIGTIFAAFYDGRGLVMSYNQVLFVGIKRSVAIKAFFEGLKQNSSLCQLDMRAYDLSRGAGLESLEVSGGRERWFGL